MTSECFYTSIPKDDMCYYLDSYLGLAAEYQNPQGLDYIVLCDLNFYGGVLNNGDGQEIGHHYLTVYYGNAVANINVPTFD
jgi:hypothetical protein